KRVDGSSERSARNLRRKTGRTAPDWGGAAARSHGYPSRGRLVIALRDRDSFNGREQPAVGDRVNVGAQPAHVTIDEQRVAAVAVETERLVVGAAVVGRPRAGAGAAVGLRVVVDHADAGGADVGPGGAGGAGGAVGAIGLSPAPGGAEAAS